MNTIEAVAISTATVLLASAYHKYLWRQRRCALQWLYAKQSDSLATQSEHVREQLFQKAFVLRRSVELCLLGFPEETTQQLNHCLKLIEAFSHDLECVSDNLSAPFLKESLPLALQCCANRWIDENADTGPVTGPILELPSDWPLQESDKHRLILWCVRECLKIWQSWQEQIAPEMSKQVLKLGLTQDRDIAKLQLTLSRQVSQEISQKKSNSYGTCELHYIQQIFQMLMPGECQLMCNHSKLEGEFRWSLVSTDSERGC